MRPLAGTTAVCPIYPNKVVAPNSLSLRIVSCRRRSTAGVTDWQGIVVVSGSVSDGPSVDRGLERGGDLGPSPLGGM